MRLEALLVEAFAAAPCQGNGAAVVRMEEPLDDGRLQALARSLNQSETAFLLACGDDWLLRWFTPTCEVALCGHATLAALLALGHWGALQPGQSLDLLSRSGRLPVQLDSSRHDVGTIALPSPGLQAAAVPSARRQLLRAALGEAPLAYWTSSLGYRVVLLPAGAPLEQLQLPLQELAPEERSGLVLMQALAAGPHPQVLGCSADYQLRFFAPDLGIAEDPVTGSAHALVAPYWQNQLGRDRVTGWQCSPRPGGMLCESASSGKIRLTGSGHLLWNGSLHLPGFSSASAASAEQASAAWGALRS